MSTPSTSWFALGLSVLVGCADLGGVSGPGGPGPGNQVDAGDVTGGRVVRGLQLLYDFSEGSGTAVVDRSGQLPEMLLQIVDPQAVSWIAGGGLSFQQPSIVRAVEIPTKIHVACRDANQLTMEAWLRSAGVGQVGPARVMTYSMDPENSNFTLGQEQATVQARVRTTQTDANGAPGVEALGNAFDGGVHHVVYTRSELQAALWIDGVLVGSQEIGGDFADWQLGYQFALGNELTLDRPWIGDLYLVAVYCTQLAGYEIGQNYDAGY